MKIEDMMNVIGSDNIKFIKELERQLEKDVYSYYKYALQLVSEDPSCLKQMIKCVYYPLSLYFGNSISCIECSMREAVSRLYIRMPGLFERITKDRGEGVSPTVSEVLGMLIGLEYSDIS